MIERITKLSDDRVYRYSLWRDWSSSMFFDGSNDGERGRDSFVQFIGLNPSTADETEDDPTIRRCKDFARRWGYGAMVMTNIFAIRATDPKVVEAHQNPIGEAGVTGELNDDILLDHALHASVVICAWGKYGKHLFRAIRVKRMLVSNGVNLSCLRLNSDGSPQHPLYIPATTQPIPFPLT